MSLTQKDVLKVLELVDRAPLGRLSVQSGDLKLEIVKGAPGSASTHSFAPRAASTEAPALPPASPSLASSAPSAPQPTLSPRADGPTIKAPLLGIFYRRPEPGAPAYVEEGSIVEEDTTVALIEVMKLFNPVKAGVRGRIRRVCVENGALVEYKQDLFEIDPE